MLELSFSLVKAPPAEPPCPKQSLCIGRQMLIVATPPHVANNHKCRKCLLCSAVQCSTIATQIMSCCIVE